MTGCGAAEHFLSRRRLLFASAWSGAFLRAAQRGDAQVAATSAKPRGTAKTCIMVQLVGAASHLDTFDVKPGPWNPSDARIQQIAPGMALSETLFPQFSKIPGDLLFLRSIQSWEAAHSRGVFYVQTGHPSNPAFVAESPHIGSVVALEKGAPGPLPPFLIVNAGGEIQGAKFLGGLYEPMLAPSNAGGLATLQHFGQGEPRFQARFDLLEAVDQPLRTSPYSDQMAAHAQFYGAARRLMYNDPVAAVFRFSEEERQRYGASGFGNACIVARNAVRAKAGVSFVKLMQNGWDTHQQQFDRRYEPNLYTLCSELDRGLGMLVEDLKASGDFDSTLIVILSEFGRTPGVLNSRGGRDHHKWAMSAAMLGGGVRGGRVIGATDADGDRIIEPGWSQKRPIFMEDIASTIYSAMGIDWTKSITDTPSGRKYEYVNLAEYGRYTAVDEVFG